MLLRNGFTVGGSTHSVEYEEPETCPLCKRAIKPTSINASPYKDNNERWHLCFTYLCGSCFNAFVSVHSVQKKPDGKYSSSVEYVGPTKYEEETFGPEIADCSPQFVKIYNQAKAAEAQNLDEIAGLGYRKALEFLVKDYCIYRTPEEAESIKSEYLSRCIKTRIDNEKIKTLAERAVWIGNDETHYIRKHEAHDVEDMKRFIQAMVYFVAMELLVDKASEIEPA